MNNPDADRHPSQLRSCHHHSDRLTSQIHSELCTLLAFIRAELQLLHRGYRGAFNSQDDLSIADFISAETMSQLQLENDLKQAIAQHQIRVFYQPIVSLTAHQLLGFEALVRWMHPTLGMLLPNSFLPLAEATGSIVEIDRWVLKSACIQLRKWQQSSRQPLTMSVNFASSHLLREDVVDAIVQILQETQVDAHHLRLEFPESSFTDDASIATSILARLKRLGIAVYMNSGVSYTLLHRLKEIPLSGIKIDRSFIRGMSTEIFKMQRIQSITTTARKLEIDVVAEGVETLNQLLQLRALGCEKGQGYLFSQPLDSQAAQALI